MNIDITAIERWGRQLILPVFGFVVGMIIMVGVGRMQMATGMLAGVAEVARMLFPWTVALPAVALLWAAHRVWQLWRWENGDLIGGCLSCGGPMSHMDGRYGPYSRCRMCGSKREGHH